MPEEFQTGRGMRGDKQMIANYHTHTWRCQHASGEEREYVENAIQGGMKILGFSDHTPMPYENGYVSNVKMRMDQLEDYVDTILALKSEYKGEIEIHLGLETEYYPQYFEQLCQMTGQYPIEYFLLAQHFLGNEIDEPYSGEESKDSRTMIRYCRQVIEGMETGCFTYVAHPDLINFTGAPAVYDEWARKLCMQAKKQNLPLEINFMGIQEQKHYPNRRFWKIAGEVGNTVVFGADAHQPVQVWNPEALAEAEKIVRENHLQLLETVSFLNPFQ